MVYLERIEEIKSALADNVFAWDDSGIVATNN